jgi:FlaA1/EpsC-like NDP-sugar epimerase
MSMLKLSTVFAVLLGFASISMAQTVAEIARKERERQKSVQSKAVVIGAGNRTSTTGTMAPATTPTPPQAGGVKPVTPTDANGKDEKYWRAQFQQARDNLKRAEARAEVLDLRIKDLNTQLLRQSDIYNRENRLGVEIAMTQKDLDAARKEAEQAKQKLVDLENDLRKAGGPPGWAR